MPELPYLYQHIARDLRGYARDVCDRIQALLRGRGHLTSSWRFDVQEQTGSRGEKVMQVIVEFVYEKGDDRRRIFFLGPVFAGKGAYAPPTDLVATMQPRIVRDWLRHLFDCKDALAMAMDNGDMLGTGILHWDYFGHESDVMCVLDGVPVPKVLDFPLEEVLPRGCFVHLVDGGTGEATRGAAEVSSRMTGYGHRVTLIDPARTVNGKPRPSAYIARSVESAQQTFITSMYMTDPHGTQTPPSVVVFLHPDELPTENEATFSNPVVGPETAIMWANFLRNILLHDTTVLIVSSVPEIDRYPEKIPPLLEPWRAVAKFERVYRKSP